MTIKDVARMTGLSSQAVYKKIKASGHTLESLKNKATGHFTPEGEQIIKDLFSVDENGSQTAKNEDSTEVEKLKKDIAELTTRLKEIDNQVETMTEKIKALTDERDFLRAALDKSQLMEAAVIAKLPAPPPALPATEAEKRHGLRAWFNRKRGGKSGN